MPSASSTARRYPAVLLVANPWTERTGEGTRLSRVAGTAVMGKATETKGDSLAGFIPDLTASERQDFLADPLGKAFGNPRKSIAIGYDRRQQDPPCLPKSTATNKRGH